MNIKIDWKDKRWEGDTGSDLFEELCKRILSILGFFNVDRKQGSYDGGRDLVGEIIRGDLLELTISEKWWFQCKRYTESINEGHISKNLLQALSETEVDFLLIVTNSHLTTPLKNTIDRLNKNKMLSFKIRYLENDHLESIIYKVKDQIEDISRFFDVIPLLSGTQQSSSSKISNLSEDQKLKLVQGLNKKNMIDKILVPLFQSMGLKSTIHRISLDDTHVEIVYYKKDDDLSEDISFNGVKVEISDINDEEHFNSLVQSFEKPVLFQGKEISYEKRYILTTRTISQEITKNNNYSYIDGKKLVKLIDKNNKTIYYNDLNYKQVLLKFKDLIDNNNTDLQVFLDFFIENPWLIFASIGSNYSEIISDDGKAGLPKVDFLLKTSTGGYFDILIAKPHNKPFQLSKAWMFSKEVTEGINQLFDYYYSYERTIEAEDIRSGVVYRPKGFLLIGRDKGAEKERVKIFNNYNQIKVLTYDSLYEKAKIYYD